MVRLATHAELFSVEGYEAKGLGNATRGQAPAVLADSNAVFASTSIFAADNTGKSSVTTTTSQQFSSNKVTKSARLAKPKKIQKAKLRTKSKAIRKTQKKPKLVPTTSAFYPMFKGVESKAFQVYSAVIYGSTMSVAANGLVLRRSQRLRARDPLQLRAN